MKTKKINSGRKLFDGKNEKMVVQKLTDYFRIGLSDEEACKLAGISRSALNNYCKKNPDFYTEKRLLKDNIRIRAKIVIADEITKNKNVQISKWYLERKDPEFSLRKQNFQFGELSEENRITEIEVILPPEC